MVSWGHYELSARHVILWQYNKYLNHGNPKIQPWVLLRCRNIWLFDVPEILKEVCEAYKNNKSKICNNVMVWFSDVLKKLMYKKQHGFLELGNLLDYWLYGPAPCLGWGISDQACLVPMGCNRVLPTLNLIHLGCKVDWGFTYTQNV